MSGICELSGAEIGREVKSGNLTPTEIVNYTLERIEKRDKTLHAFTYTRKDDAIQQAHALEEKISKGEEIGPMAGAPTGLKDFLPSKRGWTNHHGGVPIMAAIDDSDSEFWKAACKADAIAIGKTNAPAYGFRGLTDNIMYGPTSTPFNIHRNSGGSSGGSAAAVADGMLAFAESGDAGGSTRVPASWCNCFGYKASIGTVPSVCRPDAWAATHPYCFNGSETKTVEDAAILLNYMSRYDPRDPLSIPKQDRDFTELMKRPIKDWKIGFTVDFDLFPVDTEIADMVCVAANKFKEAGAIVEPVSFSFKRSLEEYTDMWLRSISIDSSIELELMKQQGTDIARDYADQVPYEFLYWQNIAFNSTVMDYRLFNEIRTEIYDQHLQAFSQFDIILSPVTSCLPPFNKADGETTGPRVIRGQKINPLIGFCQTFLQNYTGHPAASIPIGLSEEGLPVGMQIIGNRFKDEDVFAAAHTFEQISPWRQYYKIAHNREIR